MHRRTTVSIVVVIAISLLLSLIGCQQPAPAAAPTKAAAAAPTTAPTPAAATKPAAAPAAPTQAPAAPTATPVVETLKLGLQASLTGPMSKYGIGLERFVRMAMDDLNAKGGVKVGNKVYKLDAVTVDDKGTAEGGRDAGNRLILAEKVKYILSTLGSQSSGSQTITEASNVLLLAMSMPDVGIGSKFPLTFMMQASPMMRFVAVYNWLRRDHPEVKTVALLMPDDAGGRGSVHLARQAATDAGFKLVLEDFFTMDASKDQTPIIIRALREKPDAVHVIVGGRGPQNLQHMKVLSEQGFKGPVIGPSADFSALKSGSASGISMENVTVSALADVNSSAVSADERSIVQRYIQKYTDADLEPTLTVQYNALLMLAQALEKAGSIDDPSKIAKTLREGQWDTIWSKEYGKAKFIGTKTYGIPVLPEQPVYLSGIRNGQVVTFSSIKGVLD